MNVNNLYVVADFDRTITKSDSQTSWAVLANTKYMPSRYSQDRKKLYETYRPIEIDNNVEEKIKYDKMREWFEKHIKLFISYKLKEGILEKSARDTDIMELRDGAKEFIEFLNNNNVPLIIISAGIGNCIKAFLKHNECYYPNINIVSNMIEFKEGIASGVERDIIHSLNKNEIAITEEIQKTIKGRDQILLLGDQLGDIKMVSESKREQTIRVGFLTEETESSKEEFVKNFDIVCERNSSYKELKDFLFT